MNIWIKKALAMFGHKPKAPEPIVLKPWEDPSRPKWVRDAWKAAEPKSLKLKKGA